MAWHRVATAIAVVLSGCGSPRAYVCSIDGDCVANGVEGRCEPTQFCSFPDPACGGNRYEPNAGDQLGGTCVNGGCGGVGQPCCDDGPACGGNGYCNAGTCAACLQDLRYGRGFGCAVAHDRTVWCIGSNGRSQVGLDTEDRSTTWTSIRDAVSGQPITDAIAIGTGGDHACAIRDDTSVWCWGRNNHGHLGNSSTTDSAVAVQVTMLSNSMPLLGAVTVGAGRDHTCAITSSSGVWCWGLNDVGQLGDGSAAPEQHQAVAVQSSAGGALGGVTEISVGRDHTCATTANDEVWCWGANDYGQLANDSPMGFHATAVAIGTWRSVAAGQPDYTCMVDSANHAWCAGSSFRQRLGNGAHTTEEAIPERYATPQPVLAAHDGTQLGEVAKAVAGSASCALMIDHTVRCWGSNNHGQVGTGIGTGYPLPVIFQDGTPLTDVVELTAGYSHTCARTSAGALLCWGRGTDGELADGSLTEHGFPTPITAPSCP